ncbi:NAD(P)/FAD-dependent oxidoreductase [Dactylosporangium sp. CA-052675]|uniref:NAD(P)/FAD-dependent oxidoreductase n=1 Tax=Dactylosporangium sp. CA-052675 TaxID=3239927 RepID=UPI003D8B5DAE
MSFWTAVLPPPPPRPALAGDEDADVCVVGAGYTGLWTAYYLAVADPSLRITVLEAEHAGFGASGRNGGWCSALFPKSVGYLDRTFGREAALALNAAMESAVDEVGRVAAAEGIDCDYAKGGTVVLARSPAQLARARAEVAEAARYGIELHLLSAAEAKARAGATDVLGGTYTPHCAAIQPAKLVRGLAAACVRRGVRIYERSAVTRLGAGVATTALGRVRAPVVVRATEGFTPRLPGHRRVITPLYSLMIATHPLPPAFWAEAGLAARETFADGRHLIIYGQRTADDRLAFGGRGAPYHYGSAIDPAFDHEPRVFADLARVLRTLFPFIGDEVPVARAWGGPLGVARDWMASVGLDRATGLAWAGGYVGDGVGTANLAGRTLADLITGAGSDLVRLPWVGHRSPNWEPEPLRWLGINASLRLMTASDAAEARTGRPAKRAELISRMLGN